jgi:hypothetical protein
VLAPRKTDAGVFKEVGLSKNCVTTKDVKNNNLKAVDIKDESGADVSGGDQELDLTNTGTTARFVTVTAPRPGLVMVNATGFFFFNDVQAAARCGITAGTDIEAPYDTVGSGVHLLPFGLTRGYLVEEGSTTFNLMCQEFDGRCVGGGRRPACRCRPRGGVATAR